MEGLEDDGFDLFMDNYYTSPQLFLTLYNKGVNCCGTARVNRKGFPKSLVKKKKRIGDILIIFLLDLSLQSHGSIESMCFFFLPHTERRLPLPVQSNVIIKMDHGLMYPALHYFLIINNL